jgi:hypothetical protein
MTAWNPVGLRPPHFRSLQGTMGKLVREVHNRGTPPNKPLQRTIPPQGHWCNINEPLVRRARR